MLTKKQMKEIEHKIVKELFSSNIEDFQQWMYENMQITSMDHQDGLFYNENELIQFKRFVLEDDTYGT